MLAELISQIENELRNRHEGYVRRVDEVLAKIAALSDADCIGRLLPLLDDDAEYDEVCFGIIHTIERFDDAVYVQVIVNQIESLLEKSPRWATIVHMRILNSPATLIAYGECIRKLAVLKRGVVRRVLEAVRQKSSKFEARCDELLALL
jgi:hypothetical protein